MTLRNILENITSLQETDEQSSVKNGKICGLYGNQILVLNLE